MATETRWSQAAAAYAADVAPAFVALETYLLDLARPRPGERALDIGCGSGLTCRLLAARLGPGAVTGIDPAEGMLRVAAAGLGNACHLARMRGDRLGFRPTTFDLITCAFAFHLIADPAGLLCQARELLRPGGRLAICVWGRPGDDPAGDLLDALLTPQARAKPPERMGQLARPGRLRAELQAAGFARVRIRRRWDVHYADVDGAWRLAAFWRLADLNALGREERLALEARGRDRLRALAGSQGVPWRREVAYALAYQAQNQPITNQSPARVLTYHEHFWHC